MYIPDDLRDIAAMFKSAGHQLFVVGGSVRDALLGKDPKDYDVATDAVPDTVSEILSSDPTLKVLEIGKSFGVVKVVTPEKNEYEIATFRKETYLKSEDKDDFIRFLRSKGPEYEKRLRIFIDRSRDT
jgi:tRNA nucleotidyltransferase/poly(A) polymerase